MTIDRIKQTMAAILEIEPENIDDSTDNDSVEKWDSIQHMNLVIALEDEFGITIPDEDAANITSFTLIKMVVTEQMGS